MIKREISVTCDYCGKKRFLRDLNISCSSISTKLLHLLRCKGYVSTRNGKIFCCSTCYELYKRKGVLFS